MGKHFWPCYLAVAAISCAIVWRFAPVVGAKLPQEARARICQFVDATATVFSGGRRESDQSDCTRILEDMVPVDGGVETNAATVPPPSANASTGRDKERTPSQRGVRPVDPIHAAWGVLTRITPVEGLDGTPLGNAPGGRFFKIKETITTPSGLKVTGAFVSGKMTRSVRIPAENLNALSGTYLHLSTNQQFCLRKYYELTGEAEELKAKLMRDASLKSPYIQAAADALSELRNLQKAAEKIKPAASDELRKATYDISQLRNRVQELNQKHKEWKAQHASELSDPEQNPAYLEILNRRRRYAEPIPGIIF